MFGRTKVLILIVALWFCLWQSKQSYHVNKLSPRDDLDPYSFSSTRLPHDERLRPSIGNGHLSTVIHSPFVYMNGLYNGRGRNSHRAAIPSPHKANVTLVNKRTPSSRIFSLHTREGLFRETIEADNCTILVEWYAHRAVLPLLVLDVEVRRSSFSSTTTPIHIDIHVSPLKQSPDINFEVSKRSVEQVSGMSETKKASVIFRHGRTKQAETISSKRESVFCVFHQVPSVLEIEAGVLHRRWTFLASIHSRRNKTEEAFYRGVQLIESGRLRPLHIEYWNATWNNGSIEVEGNAMIARTVAASQYYILSSLPPYEDADWPFIGLSPSGLAWGSKQNYNGHVFWDQETWMYPPVLLLHEKLGRMLLNTRVRTMRESARNAIDTGYRGLRYVWESAYTGTETSPSRKCATLEVHINGDISFAMEQFWWATGDEKLFTKNKSKIADVVFGIADFWKSRLTFNTARQLFELTGVMPPDEYAVGVNNSVYTNVIAKRTLEFASEVAQILKMPERQKMYEKYAGRVYIPFDASLGYHPEYDGYVQGSTVKQADVILLGFPLMCNMSAEVRLKDLETYEKVTSPRGPAMSDSMYAIGWLELKQYERAVKSFDRMFAHVSSDFQVWTENRDGSGATNFITGMGGFLQSIIFGFGGVRLNQSHIKVDPVLPPGCSRMLFKNVDYRGSSLSMDFDQSSVTLTLVSNGRRELCVGFNKELVVLRLHQPLTVARGELVLKLCPVKKFKLISEGAFNSIL